MKLFNYQALGGLVVTAALFLIPSASRAEDTNKVSSAKPDLLKTCPISGEKLGGDMGEPYKFVYQGQEVKLCCSMCKAKFDKDPAKYIKIIQAAADASKK